MSPLNYSSNIKVDALDVLESDEFEVKERKTSTRKDKMTNFHPPPGIMTPGNTTSENTSTEGIAKTVNNMEQTILEYKEIIKIQNQAQELDFPLGKQELFSKSMPDSIVEEDQMKPTQLRAEAFIDDLHRQVNFLKAKVRSKSKLYP